MNFFNLQENELKYSNEHNFSNDPSPIEPIEQHTEHNSEKLKEFLSSAPSQWNPEQPIQRFPLANGEFLSCIMWHGLFFMTGTDIVRGMVYRFECYGRTVKNFKKFEEGIFSDLRNLKPGIDAILEEPRSEFLEMLYRNNCIRTQKKQKVFFWFSVPHDRLFIDAIERDLKRESTGIEPTTVQVDSFPEEEDDGTKRHPLCHAIIPRRADKFLIHDMASVTPGNNSQALQIQQRQMLMEQKLLSSPFGLEGYYNPGLSNGLFSPSPSFYSPSFDMNVYSPSFSTGFSPMSEDPNSFHDILTSPSLDMNPRSTFNSLPFDSQMMNMSPTMPDNFPAMNSNYKLLITNHKSFHPYSIPNHNDNNNTCERPHVCQVEYCGRAFKRSDQLRRHHKTHEHPHPCPFPKCSRSFNRKDQLDQHLALHHPQTKTSQPTKPASPLLTNIMDLGPEPCLEDLSLKKDSSGLDLSLFSNSASLQPDQESNPDPSGAFMHPYDSYYAYPHLSNSL